MTMQHTHQKACSKRTEHHSVPDSAMSSWNRY